MTEVENRRVEDFGEDLRGFDKPGSRPAEELSSVGDEEFSFADRPQLLPGRPVLKALKIDKASLDRKAAWNDENEIGVACLEHFPIDPRRMLA